MAMAVAPGKLPAATTWEPSLVAGVRCTSVPEGDGGFGEVVSLFEQNLQATAGSHPTDTGSVDVDLPMVPFRDRRGQLITSCGAFSEALVVL